MAIAAVQSATQVNVAGSSTTAPSITITGTAGGNALVAYASIFDGNTTWTLTSTTDGANTFTTRAGVGVDTGESVRAVASHAVNITGGDRTVAFNLSGTSGAGGRYYVLGCTEFSGVATSAAEDTFDANDTINLGTTDANAGPITTTDAGALITGAISNGYNDTTINNASPTSWTNTYRQDNGLSFVGMDAGYWLPGATQTTYTAQWSHDNTAGDIGAGVVVALLPAGGAADPEGRLIGGKLIRGGLLRSGVLH
jgi:hypothetical protein